MSENSFVVVVVGGGGFLSAASVCSLENSAI